MNRTPTLFFAALLLPAFACAQSQVIPLWKDGAPGFESLKDVPEQAHDYWVRNVNNPTLAVFLPPKGKANGTAVVIAPGGGFRELVYNAEGRQPAEFFNSLGVAAFVLKYRLPKAENSPYKMENVQQDIERAMRLVRARSAQFQVNPDRIGILGFSAGGAVAMMVSFYDVHGDANALDPIDRLSARPNFEMIVYPGQDSLPKVVPPDSGPAFLVCANDDQYKCDEVAMQLLQKLRDSGVSVEAHFMAQGKHAFNMGDRSPYIAIRHWPQRLAEWMEDRGLLKPTGVAANP